MSSLQRLRSSREFGGVRETPKGRREREGRFNDSGDSGGKRVRVRVRRRRVRAATSPKLKPPLPGSLLA